jgi:hypothetical protein
MFLTIHGSCAYDQKRINQRRVALDKLQYLIDNRANVDLDKWHNQTDQLMTYLTGCTDHSSVYNLIRIKHNGSELFILLSPPREIAVPGNNGHIINIFNNDADLLNTTFIYPGNRQMFLSYTVDFNEIFQDNIIRMDVGEFMVVNPVLVRMENISGKPLRNIYSFASNMKGPPLPSWGME